MDILDDELNGIAGDNFENFGYSHRVVHVLNDENLNRAQDLAASILIERAQPDVSPLAVRRCSPSHTFPTGRTGIAARRLYDCGRNPRRRQ